MTGSLLAKCCCVQLPRGACCLPNRSCLEDVTEVACETQRGVWHVGDLCSEVDCEIPEPQRCCFPDGGCQVLLPDDCILAGGDVSFGNVCPGSPVCPFATCQNTPVDCLHCDEFKTMTVNGTTTHFLNHFQGSCTYTADWSFPITIFNQSWQLGGCQWGTGMLEEQLVCISRPCGQYLSIELKIQGNINLVCPAGGGLPFWETNCSFFIKPFANNDTCEFLGGSSCREFAIFNSPASLPGEPLECPAGIQTVTQQGNASCNGGHMALEHNFVSVLIT